MGVFGGHSPKAPKTKTEKAISITRKLLTLQEITRNKPVLIKLVLWTSDHADDLLTATTKGHAEVIIWSNLEYDDAELLVDHFLSMGQKSEYWADAVRKTLEWEEKVKLGAIIIPRAVKTIVYLFTTGIEIRW